jgi:RNA polymerase sigma factor (sigma-70 family)
LVQDTLIRVRQRFARFERDTFSEFKQWSRAVLYRRQQEWIRNHKTRHSERNLQRIWDALSQNKTSDAASSLDSGLITAEQRAWLDEKLSQLKRHERFIIDLRVCHEMEFAEIADRTGLSSDAARMAFNRALARLRRIADA